MTKPQHTPGPWLFEDISSATENDGMGYIYGLRSTSDPIAHTGDAVFTPKENRANAHLIAAAPDLLEALQSMMGFYGMDERRGEVSGVIFDEARAALAKAKGQDNG